MERLSGGLQNASTDRQWRAATCINSGVDSGRASWNRGPVAAWRAEWIAPTEDPALWIALIRGHLLRWWVAACVAPTRISWVGRGKPPPTEPPLPVTVARGPES